MVSEQTLLHGSWYALEQAGRLIRSALTLFRNGDPGTAVAVAMFGREELGRSRILRKLAQQTKAGKKLSAAEVRKLCEDHVKKQAAAALSTNLRFNAPSQLAEAARARFENELHSQAWQHANDTINAAIDAKRKKDPHSRHQARVRGLYVDLDPAGTAWTRPAALDAAAAQLELEDAFGDYTAECDRLREEVLLQDFPEMARVRATMQPSPVLPALVWPPHGLSTLG